MLCICSFLYIVLNFLFIVLNFLFMAWPGYPVITYDEKWMWDQVKWEWGRWSVHTYIGDCADIGKVYMEWHWVWKYDVAVGP